MEFNPNFTYVIECDGQGQCLIMLSVYFITTGEGDRKRSLRSHRPEAGEGVSSDANGIGKLNARTPNHGTNCHENSHFHVNNIKQEGHQFSLGSIKQEPCNTRVSRSVSLLSHCDFQM
jgi:hypothetical protein